MPVAPLPFVRAEVVAVSRRIHDNDCLVRCVTDSREDMLRISGEELAVGQAVDL